MFERTSHASQSTPAAERCKGCEGIPFSRPARNLYRLVLVLVQFGQMPGLDMLVQLGIGMLVVVL